MRHNEENSNFYSAADIQRYLRGEMSAEEMHAIETAALDDPFLADAIEGFEMAMKEDDQNVIQSDLARLNKEFASRIEKPVKIVPLTPSRWWQVAAAAVILFVVGLAVYNNRFTQDESKAPALAVAEKKTNDSSTLPKPEQERSTSPFAVADSQISPDKKSPPPLSPKPSDEGTSRVSAQNKDQPYNELSKVKAGSAIKQAEAQDDQKKESAQLSARRIHQASVESPVSATPRDYNAEATKAYDSAVVSRQLASQLNNFSGRVVDPANKPLPYATLQIMPGRMNVVTDQAGNFNFSSKDSVVDVHVELIGFEQRNFRLQNSVTSNKLVLEPGSQNLEEVVVSGYGNERKKDASKITGKVQNAVPEIGWIEYEKYIEANKKPPIGNPLLKGEVVVSFEVKKPNVLADFKIEKSLSKDHDKEAIRLIQQGPAWKLLSTKKTRITVIVQF